MGTIAPDPNAVRKTWLRRFSAADPRGCGQWHPHALYAIGNAAARETLVTGTRHMSGIWTSLFADMLCIDSELRWVGDGPGVGRDARIAYSSLLGRYVARAYLTAREGVRVLVPLEVAKDRLRNTGYSIDKVPSGSRGLQADWIGLDSEGRLVIAEAKGSFDRGKGTWHGPSRPQLLKTAQDQAERTVVHESGRRPLPARRWAVVSRWGTEINKREPTVLASCDGDTPLDPADYVALARHLLDSDRRAVMIGLGHSDVAATLPNDGVRRERWAGDTRLRVRGFEFPPGFAAVAGPFGFRPLRGVGDFLSAAGLLIDDSFLRMAVVSVSSRHATSVPEATAAEATVFQYGADDVSGVVEFAGLSVAWPREANDLVFLDT